MPTATSFATAATDHGGYTEAEIAQFGLTFGSGPSCCTWSSSSCSWRASPKPGALHLHLAAGPGLRPRGLCGQGCDQSTSWPGTSRTPVPRTQRRHPPSASPATAASVDARPTAVGQFVHHGEVIAARQLLAHRHGTLAPSAPDQAVLAPVLLALVCPRPKAPGARGGAKQAGLKRRAEAADGCRSPARNGSFRSGLQLVQP